MSESEKVEDKKPSTGEGAGGNTHVSLKIGGTGFPELLIKVKKSTRLEKMMRAYCERAGKAMTDVRFLFEGSILRPDQLVEHLDIDEDDEEVMIEVQSEAIGGC